MTTDDVRAELAHLRDETAALIETYLARPLLRGVSHVLGFFAALGGGLVLVVQAGMPLQVIASAIYGAGLAAMLGTSALYHRIRWRPRAFRWVQKIDHSMIFVLVASSYTPFLLLALDGWWRIGSMVAVWGLAAAGITMRVAIANLPRAIHVASYLLIGWAALVVLPQLVRQVPRGSLELMLVGGLLYSIGAVVYLRQRPDPLPRIFGFHEVFHVFVLAAASCHFAAVWPLVTSAMPAAG